MKNFEKKISNELNKLLDLKVKKNADRFRDKLDLFVAVQEKRANIIEAGIELGIVDSVVYKKKKYPVRTLVISLPDECDGGEDTLHEYLIATEELFDAFGENPDVWSMRANTLDQEIYHYLSPEDFLLSGREIATKCLDEVFQFHYEAKVNC